MVHNHNTSSLCRDALSQLMLITSLMARDLEQGLAGYGLTEARARVIWELSSGDGLTQRELARRLDVTPRNITTLIDGLEQTGFADRTPHPSDRRATVVVLSEKGLATAAKLQSEMTKFSTDLFGDLEQEDLKTLIRILGRTGTRLESLMEDSPQE